MIISSTNKPIIMIKSVPLFLANNEIIDGDW